MPLVYVWSRLPTLHSLPLQPVNHVPSILREMQHGLKRLGKEITPFDAPPGVELWSPDPVGDRASLFFDVKLESEELNVPLPDILTIYGQPLVSESFRDALAALDPEGGHEFIPALIYDVRGRPVAKEPWFHLWCGRIVRQPEAGPEDHDITTDARLRGVEHKAFANRAQALFLAKLPVWQLHPHESMVFFDEAVFDGLRARGLKGIDPFTERGGRYETLPDGTELDALEFTSHIRF